eukprot:13537131-Heterocapsa_arctica.AAC.1
MTSDAVVVAQKVEVYSVKCAGSMNPGRCLERRSPQRGEPLAALLQEQRQFGGVHVDEVDSYALPSE